MLLFSSLKPLFLLKHCSKWFVTFFMKTLDRVKAPKEMTHGPESLKKDSIYLTSKSPPALHEAYLGQFQHDFKLFLKSRSEELVSGGRMVLTLIGREDTFEIRTTFELIDLALHDMVLENLIEEVKLESFDVPLYDPTIEEAKKVIQEEESFTLQRLETIRMGWDANKNEGLDDNVLDENMRGEFIAKHIRALTEPLLKALFGEGIMDELFLRFKNMVVQLIKKVEILEFPSFVISLIKNV